MKRGKSEGSKRSKSKVKDLKDKIVRKLGPKPLVFTTKNGMGGMTFPNQKFVINDFTFVEMRMDLQSVYE
jgi:hypothetical protein